MKDLLILVFLIPFLLSSYSYGAKKDEVIAIVGNKKITKEHFDSKYKEVQSNTLNPPDKKLFLEDLIRYEIGVQEAEKRNLENDPIVAERIRQEMYKGLIEKELGKVFDKIKVTEKEMKYYYRKNPEIRTSHILVQVRSGADANVWKAAEKRAKEIYAEVRKSKRQFEELVRLYTDDTNTKNTGGDIGWQTRLTLVPEFYDAAVGLSVGKISKLTKTKFGFHIIKLTGKNSYQKSNKRHIRAAVFDEKRKRIFDRYFSKLKGKYKLKVYNSKIE